MSFYFEHHEITFDCRYQEFEGSDYYFNSDLIVSCPKDSKKMINETLYDFDQILIKDESVVEIFCGEKGTAFSFDLTVESSATVYLNGKCNIRIFKIYGNPIISYKSIDAKVLYLYDSDVHYVRASNTIDLYKNNDGIYIPQIGEYECQYIYKFKLDNTIKIECIDFQYHTFSDDIVLYEFEIPYDLIQYYTFYSNQNLYIYNISTTFSTLQKYYRQIDDSIIMNGKFDKVFVDFLNPEDIEYLHSNIDNKYINMMRWTYYDDCDDFFFSNYRNDDYLNFIDDLVQNSRWRKICINDKPHIILHEDKQGDIISISTLVVITIIILALVIIVLMISNLCCIAYCKYKKEKEKVYKE